MRNSFGSMFCLLLIVGCSSSAGTSGATSATGHSTSTNESGSSSSAQKADSVRTTGRALRIAVIPKGTTHVFWKSVHAGAEMAAKELGGVNIIWKGSLLEDDRDGQLNVVQDFVTAKVDGICLAPLDKQALVGPVREAVESGIPVVIFDSALQDESKIVSYVATDNFQGGAIAARQMAASMGGQGNVIVLRYTAGSESTEQREEGFLAEMKTAFPQIKILSSDQYAGTTPEQALDKATQLLSKYRGKVNGIFANNESSANGVLLALKETQLAGQVKFIAFDPSSELIRGLTEGSCHGIVLQDPVRMGYDSVMALVKSIRGETVSKRINTGEYLATPENMNTPEIGKLLNPNTI